MTLTGLSGCAQGDAALARGAWTEARDAFDAALAVQETPESLEGLATAGWWLDLADIVFDARERAHRLYLANGNRRAAARVAVWLAWDYWAFRGEPAVANGWLQRARRLLDDEPACAERAWLDIREGSMCLFEEGDTERGFALAGDGIRIAREAGSVDLEMLGRAVQGLALVHGKRVVPISALDALAHAAAIDVAASCTPGSLALDNSRVTPSTIA